MFDGLGCKAVQVKMDKIDMIHLWTKNEDLCKENPVINTFFAEIDHAERGWDLKVINKSYVGKGKNFWERGRYFEGHMVRFIWICSSFMDSSLF